MAISDNQRDDNADTRQKNQPDSVISNGVWYKNLFSECSPVGSPSSSLLTF